MELILNTFGVSLNRDNEGFATSKNINLDIIMRTKNTLFF